MNFTGRNRSGDRYQDDYYSENRGGRQDDFRGRNYESDWNEGRNQRRGGEGYGFESERNQGRSGFGRDGNSGSNSGRSNRGNTWDDGGNQEYYTTNEWNQRSRGGSNRGGQQDDYRQRNYSSNESMIYSRPMGKEDEGLRKLLTDQLKDMYWAEKALLKAIPKMIKNASSQELIEALNEHLQVTEEQVEKVEEVFEALGEKASAKKCEAMAGLIKEAEEIMSDLDKGSVRDAGIICAAQKVEHYEIATYGCLSTYAEILDEMEAYELLEEILEEEKDADKTLTQIAREINWEAVEEDEEEEEEEESEEEEDEEEDEDDNSIQGKNKNKYNELDAIES